jgi:hypothetical protein
MEGEFVMIINASRRTDIPAFYLDWFIRRLQEGYTLVRNTMNPEQVMRVDLSPELIDCIVFWTKDPTEFLKRRSFFDAYPYYFQISLTGYDASIEPHVPDKERVIEAIIKLSESIGKERVIWRYDPIMLTAQYNIDVHFSRFKELCNRLKGHTQRCVISFVDLVESKEAELERIGYIPMDGEDMAFIASGLVQIAAEHGITVESCSEAIDLDHLGVKHGKCVDDQLIREALGVQLEVGKDKHRREMCGCVTSIDIGVYNTCAHDCRYCYANFNPRSMERHRGIYRVDSPMLADELRETDQVVKHKNA